MSEPGGGPSVRVVALLTAAALPDERARRDPQEARYQVADAGTALIVTDEASAAKLGEVSVVSPLLSGGSTYVASRFDASTFWATVGKVRPTFFSAVPTIYSTLVAGAGSQTDAGALRYVICGSAPTQCELINEFERRYGVPVVVDCGERGIFEIGGRPR
jgi:acyl-CoA synthetase (AMP-forming)/AMP-acid ligase II